MREIGSVFRLLQRHGLSQRRIAALTGQSQSEVSEILSGRQVVSYDVLVRICTGLGIPRGRVGLAFDEETAALLADFTDGGPATRPDRQPDLREIKEQEAEHPPGETA